MVGAVELMNRLKTAYVGGPQRAIPVRWSHIFSRRRIMRRDVLRLATVMIVFLFAGAALWPSTSVAAAPRLGADCGVGAIIAGNDTAGKLRLGNAPGNTCTLSFDVPFSNAPACMAVNESTEAAESMAIGTSTTAA